MFDLKVTHRNPKTGAVTMHDPYRLRIGKEGKTYERPVNSGNLWWENGEPAGRFEEGKVVIGAEHADYIKPLSRDEKVQRALNEKDSKIAKLEADMRDLELKAINQEKNADAGEVKVAPKAKAPIKEK